MAVMCTETPLVTFVIRLLAHARWRDTTPQETHWLQKAHIIYAFPELIYQHEIEMAIPARGHIGQPYHFHEI